MTPVLFALILAGILAGLGIGIGLVLLIVPGLFLLTIWAVVSPVIVIERSGVINAFTRSRDLVRGNGWQVLGVIAIFFLILLVVGAVLGAIGSALGPAGNVVAGIVSSIIVAPLVGLAGAVLYFALRGAKGDATPVAGERRADTGEADGLQAGSTPSGTDPQGSPQPVPAKSGEHGPGSGPRPPRDSTS